MELCEESQVKRLTRGVHGRLHRQTEGVQGNTHPPDIADVLPLGLRVKELRVIGDSPIELENVIKDQLIQQRVQDRHFVVRAERT